MGPFLKRGANEQAHNSTTCNTGPDSSAICNQEPSLHHLHQQRQVSYRAVPSVLGHTSEASESGGLLQWRTKALVVTTTTDLMAEEAAMSLHLLAGTYMDQGLSMKQTLAVLHKAVDLVPELEEDIEDWS